MTCRELEDKLVLYLYGELAPAEHAQTTEHLGSCAHCQGELESTRRLHGVLAKRPAAEPTASALAECRQELDRALENEPDRTGLRGLLLGWFPGLPASPAFGVLVLLTLLAVSFNVGWILRARYKESGSGATNVSQASMSIADLAGVRISGITRAAPDPETGDVRITLDGERRVRLEGSLDDPRIQQVLLYAVKSYDNAGIRRDTLDALRSRADNPNVRQVLLYAMEHDANPGVRLEALEAARGLEWGDDARGAFLQVLERDSNPGLRVAAVDVLLRHSDDQVRPAFERLAAHDTNRYVRLKCASAIRDLPAQAGLAGRND